MQPTATASVPAPGEMDLQALQSMDWLFKKERFHLLAQFWQHVSVDDRATLAEKENASLKEQLINNANSGDHKDINNMDKENNSRSNLEVEVATKDKEIVQLIEQVHRLQSTLQSIKETSRTQIQRLEEQLEHNRQHINRLESRLDQQRDYDDIKREINILRSVDLSVVNQHNENKPPPSLELLLLERQKAAAAAVAAAAAAAAASAAIVSETNNNTTTSSNNTTSTVALSPILTTATTPATTTSSSLTSSTPSNLTSSLLKPPSTPETPGVQTPQPSQTPESQHHQEHPNNLVINNNNNTTNENNNNSTSNNNNQSTTPTSLLPPPLQNVEQFGSFLGEEIVANWRRTLERPLPPMLTNSQQQLLAANHLNTNCNNELQQLTRQPPAPTPSPAPQQLDTPIKASTPIICAPPDSEKSTASTPVPTDSISSGARASPTENKSEPEDNNNHHLSNNNLSALNAAAMCNFLRNSEDVNSLKSPYRFEEHRTFRFADDMGAMPPGAMVGRLGESLIPKGDPMEARLQEMLRYNMDKYATQNLDTLTIARRVRELLSIHNIGQRLFAKYVLGLSQGTVSELLSKPKPWDKLTEKGRDSYRKMHAWACDENAVMLLKSLIPKKGKDTGMPTYGGRESSDMNEERIAHILNEASHLMKVEDTHSNDDSKSPSHGQCPSPFSKESSQNRKLKKYENDDIPQEKVLRIYQEELAKLMGRRMEDMRNTREPFTNLFFPHLFSGGVTMDRNQEEMRIAMEAYHRELAKLNQCPPGAPGAVPNLPGLLALQQQVLAQQNHLNGAQDLSLPKEKSSKIANGTPELMESQQQKEMMQKEDSQDPTSRHSGSAFSLVRPKIEPGVVQSNTNSSAPSPLGNSILPPAMTPTDEFSGAAAASPLQRMASITNSLISQPPTQSHHSPSQRPLKAVLPPITQQQFDLFNNLNTEDIVKKVKEQLSQYSISQRLFGESVLGLSQGSVSDLLARPKPWHMLTQKGREPFIRMKMFLEDDNAVHKLVASQYKIAPEKLMRTGGYGGSPCTSMTKPPMPPQAPKMMSEAAGLLNKIQQENHSALLPPSLQLGPPTSQPNMVQPPPPPMMLTPPGIPPHHPINLQNPEQLKKSQSPHPIQHSPMGQQQSSHMRSLHQHISPSVYEMAALTQDLDTQTITTKIKEALLANNIGQKIFGEAVLGLSQGSVSELLSKPKPWHMLSIKGREPFIRMQLWLSDAHNIDRLQALKNERREANKRRRSTGPGAHDNSSDTSSNDTSEFYHSNSPGPGPGPPSAKKQRVLFSEEQKEALRLAFHLDPYPNVATIEFLAAELNLSSRTITNWFHNHRMRLKQQSPHGVPNDIPVRDQSGNQPPFDPVQFRLLLNQRLLELQKERIGLGAVPLPYPPYFATNTNLAALISRGLLPTGDVDLSALNNAVKEEMSGLDLSMTSLKREPSGEYDDEDCESNVGSEVSNISGGSLHGDVKPEPKELPIPQVGNTPRSSRRKPAAPQWVKPDWQEEPKDKPAQPPQPQPTGNEVIINGVCVMQTEDYGRLNSEETVRVEPTPVMDRFDDRSDASSVSDAQETESIHENESPRITSHNKEPEDDENHDRTDCPPPTSLPPTQSELPEQDSEPVTIKTENEDERWDY
ncbi:homeobox protein cut isoform X2 [Chrysoperla carnea]|uniref:homeobox protein cut isoform X2 n=1 Tax=Chrysoperla carnea TaxID=189513 RepID=UPI001D06F3DC|nr:homeobox protein cut isoform X2 [Chrysoperla carnea]